MGQRGLSPKLFVAFALWIAAIVVGINWLMAYSFDGASVELPRHAPVEAQRMLRDEPTLVVFLHPKCPCSLATVENLKRLVSRLDRPPVVYAIYYWPADCDATWVTEGHLFKTFCKFPGVHQELDRDGKLAARWGAQKSGHVIVLLPEGRIGFSGGITDQRGHEGDSVGMLAVQALLLNQSPPVRTAPVFGCKFFSLIDGTTQVQ